MPFPIGAVIGAVAGIGSTIFGAASAKNQADAQYKEAERQARARFRRDKKEYRLANLAANTQWWWDKARVEQLRFNERQKSSDYYGQQRALIGAASNQLGARMQSLRMGFDAQMQGLALTSGARAQAVQIDSASQIKEIVAGVNMENTLEAAKASIDYSYRMGSITMETLEAARQYLNQVNRTALQAAQTVGEVQRQSSELVESLALEEQRDYLGWQLNKITALAEGASAGAQAKGRQGGGNTSRLLMAESAKRLGLTWAELQVKSQSRQSRLGLMNSAIKNEVANQMGQYALAIQDSRDKTAYAMKRGGLESQMLNDTMTKLTIPGIKMRSDMGQMRVDNVMARAAGELGIIGASAEATRLSATADFEGAKLTAAADYASTLANLNKPYREEIFFDPLKPVKGLKPEYIGPTQPSTGSLGFTIANSILSGVQGAMNFSFVNKAGQLQFY